MSSWRDIRFKYDSHEKPKLVIDDDIVYFIYNQSPEFSVDSLPQCYKPPSTNGFAQAKEKHTIEWWQERIGVDNVTIEWLELKDLCDEIEDRCDPDEEDSAFYDNTCEQGKPIYLTEFKEREDANRRIERMLIALKNREKTIEGVLEGCQNDHERRLMLDAYKRFHPQRDWKPQVKWYWGSTGTGKSKAAKEEMPHTWVGGQSLVSWRGYEKHEQVILDDIQCPPRHLYNLFAILDRYPHMVGNGRKSTALLARKIIITSRHHPTYFCKTKDDEEHLLRLIDEVREFTLEQVEKPTKKVVVKRRDRVEEFLTKKGIPQGSPESQLIREYQDLLRT